MNACTNAARATLIAGLGLLLVACAQQPSPPPAQSAAPMQGSGMAGMSDMSGMSGMQGQDHGAMMAQCADMRRQMARGTHPNTPGMAQMMQHCQEMESGMGGPAPAATRSP